ncbi:uncharacterized protein LOC128176142 [Crassostrea angulata]|uniref:uncharacterized protein LOC128176142 n=1 Tax=Magallana angulata TaxID=2784310 RepID=UPI0022B0A7BA|nr:uncharacterized protein LOC128176142 [Crassostrea angulata]XP_052698194.1 uncharacterized protein LOC128176142 [Crassostrea angulata]XP_052698195.1 uncharacterized protein LOC128176142 [Crassostrea angulata]XP_052698196.1 uncharacterized protein LOC128176142 [Crassostrea angulata]
MAIEEIKNQRMDNTSSILEKQINSEILRQAASKTLSVGVTSLEIFRNRVSKRVKILDVKLSLSYQDNFQTETERLEKQLVRHGKKWSWPVPQGSRSIVTFPYCPGDRVNLNVGLIVHTTKKHGFFSKEVITNPAGNATECIVMAKNNGVGIGLPLHTVINQHIRLNFDVDGYGHHLTMKLRCELLGESKASPSLWLRPSTADKPFRTSMSLYEILSSNENFPPKQKEDGGKMRGYICNSQRLVNYLRTAVTECWSFRPCCSNQEIPSGIQVRQISSNKPMACLIPVVEHREYNGRQHLKLALLVVGSRGPYCLCATRWRSADKFDFKIHYYEKDETWGQRIKWAARDFLDIDHIITNSTAHQFYFKPERENPFIDLCVGLALKFLVRWSDEIMPWKLEGAREFTEADFDQCNSKEADLLGAQRPRSSVSSLTNQNESLPEFLESHNLALFSDIAAKLSHVTEYIPPEPEVPRSKLMRRGSGSSYGESNHGSERYIKKEQKYRGSTKKDFKKAGSAIEIRNESDGDDFTSGFVEGCSSGPRSCPGSYVGIESLID